MNARVLTAAVAAFGLLVFASASTAQTSDPGCENPVLVSTGGAFPRDPNTLAVRWTGFSNYELAYKGDVLLLDAYFDLSEPPHFAPGADDPIGATTEPPQRAGILPTSLALDRMAYRTIAFAFPIWTFAVIAGAIWAQEAWGRYWGWDPKETWSFITWTIYAGYLHARATSGWKGRRAAAIALVGFASLLVTYYVVNIWIVGLHSYKGF